MVFQSRREDFLSQEKRGKGSFSCSISNPILRLILILLRQIKEEPSLIFFLSLPNSRIRLLLLFAAGLRQRGAP